MINAIAKTFTDLKAMHQARKVELLQTSTDPDVFRKAFDTKVEEERVWAIIARHMPTELLEDAVHAVKHEGAHKFAGREDLTHDQFEVILSRAVGYDEIQRLTIASHRKFWDRLITIWLNRIPDQHYSSMYVFELYEFFWILLYEMSSTQYSVLSVLTMPSQLERIWELPHTTRLRLASMVLAYNRLLESNNTNAVLSLALACRRFKTSLHDFK